MMVTDMSKIKLLIMFIISVSLCALLLSCGDTKDKKTVDGISFDGAEFTYDGTEKNIYIKGQLPDGVTVSYDGNGKTDAGTYTVTAKFTVSDEYEPIADMTAEIKIAKASYDMSGVSFPSQVFEYDGSAKSIEISGTLPTGVTVSYDGNGQREIGDHVVTAIFSTADNNYNAPADMTAYLTICPETVTVTFRQAGKDDIVRELPKGGSLSSDMIPEPATEAGYDLSWDRSDFSEINEDIIVLCVKQPKVYTIKYVGVSNDALPDGCKYSFTIEDLPLSLEPASMKTAIFVSWHTNSALTSPIESITDIGNKTLYAELSDETPGLEYALLDGGTYEVTGYSGNMTNVLIPAMHDGKKVTSVHSSAFRGNSQIEYVQLSDNVINIGNSAFRDCTSLSEIKLGNNIGVIGAYAFAGTALTDAVLPDSLVSIGESAYADVPLASITLPFIGGSQNSSKTYLGYIFGASSYIQNASVVPASLKEVILSDKCTSVPANAFYGCSGIERIDLGGATEIQNYAFNGCTSLKTVFIPLSVKDIYANAYPYNSPFYNCSPDLVIYLECDDGSAFGAYWNYISDTETAECIFGAEEQV